MDWKGGTQCCLFYLSPCLELSRPPRMVGGAIHQRRVSPIRRQIGREWAVSARLLRGQKFTYSLTKVDV